MVQVWSKAFLPTGKARGMLATGREKLCWPQSVPISYLSYSTGNFVVSIATPAPDGLWSTTGNQTRTPSPTRRPTHREPPSTPPDQHHRQPYRETIEGV